MAAEFASGGIIESIIRPAKTQEAALLSDLAFRSKGYWGYSAAFMDACREELGWTAEQVNDRNRCFRILEIAGVPVGMYILQKKDGDRCELEALFVEPAAIGKGYGRQLIEHARFEAQKAGFRTMVIQGDPNAQAFYLAAGGVQTGERESGSIPGRYLPLFEISLE